MAVILADTDVLIDYLCGVQPLTERMRRIVAQKRLATTAVTCFELLSGAREGSWGERVRRLVATLDVVPLERQAATRAAVVRQQLEQIGETIGMGDSLLAGIALTHDARLWTRNRKHFERVSGLELVPESD